MTFPFVSSLFSSNNEPTNNTSTTATTPERCHERKGNHSEHRDDVETEGVDRFHVQVQTKPETPEGLRSRPDISALRRELQLDHRPQQGRPFLVEKKTQSNSFLPPAPSSSWSIPRIANPPPIQQQPLQQNSPQISLSGFYGDSGMAASNKESTIAQSPYLLPGLAKTAVGALVAKQQGKGGTNHPNQHPPLLQAASSASTTGYEGDADRPGASLQENMFPVLPQYNEWGNHQLLPEAEVVPDDDDHDHHDMSSSNNIDTAQYVDLQPYYPLDKDPIQQSRTPPRPNTKIKQYISPMTVGSSFLGQSPGSLSRKQPGLDHSSLAASPSSLIGHRYLLKGGGKTDGSITSRDGLIVAGKREEESRGYDFRLVVDGRVGDEVFASDQTHVSAMSFSMPDGEKHPLEELNDIVEVEDDDFDGGEVQIPLSERPRPAREDLIVAAVERLQDDIQLVGQVEEGGRAVTQELGDWFVKTQVDKEGILTGFQHSSRLSLCNRLTAVLEEMNSVAQTEDYMLLSPSELPLYTETHSDLYRALVLAKSLIQMAIPAKEQNSRMQNPNAHGNKWKIDGTLYRSMNLVPASPEATQRCGGDTSIFTLPSESADTPMTSNLSVGSDGNKGWASKRKLHSEGLQIVRTIELLSSLVEKMSMACRQWLESSLTTDASVKVTREMKRLYLQLMDIPYDDLRALVDAFDLVKTTNTVPMISAVPSIAKLVSNDEEDTFESKPLGDTHNELSRIQDEDEFTAINSQDMESAGHTVDEVQQPLLLNEA